MRQVKESNILTIVMPSLCNESILCIKVRVKLLIKRDEYCLRTWHSCSSLKSHLSLPVELKPASNLSLNNAYNLSEASLPQVSINLAVSPPGELPLVNGII